MMPADAAMIAHAAATLFAPGTVVELRIPTTPRQGVVSGYFDSAPQFVQAAVAWSGTVPGIYSTINPCVPALLARAANRLKERAKTTTSDRDVVQRRWFPLDFDPVRPADISATDAEHVCALARAQACTDWLTQRGWPAPVAADSGNGGHRLYQIDLPNDDDSRALVQHCLEALALYFTDSVVALDVSVFNAARIWKVYGTMACKGDDLPERPHRLSQILDIPTPVEPVSRRHLDALAALVPPPPQPAATAGRSGRPPFDLAQWITTHGLPVVAEGPWQQAGYRWVLNPCPWNPAHTNKAAFIVQLANGAIAAGCHHNGCHGNDWPALGTLYEPGWHPAPAPAIFQVGSQPAPAGSATPPSVPGSPSGGVSGGAPGQQTSPPRPDIFLTPEITQITDETQGALLAHPDAPVLYQRARRLAVIARGVPPPRWLYRPQDLPIMLDASPARLTELVSQAAHFWRYDLRRKRWAETLPPRWVIDTLATRATWPFPVLEGIVASPTLRPDGSLLDVPGYDRSTGLFLDTNGTLFPPVPVCPSLDAARAALVHLSEPLIDFPFAEP
jgi:hypothetical protein